MTIRAFKTALAAFVISLGATVSTLAAEIRVMISGEFAVPFSDLAAAFEARTGHKVVTILGSSQGGAADSIPSRLARGEGAHVVLIGRELLVELTRRGLLSPDGARDVFNSRMGMAVRAGIPKPDISTLDAFRRAMLEAGSIAYSASVSGTFLSTAAFQRLGISDQVLPKARQIMSERIGAVLARGEADIGFQQISELLPFANQIQYVGPLPDDIQRVTVFSAAATVTSPDPALSRLVIDFMVSREAHAIVRKYALDPVGATPEDQMLAGGFAPMGRLRAVINLGNPVLARRVAPGGPLSGVSIDLANELARRVGVLVEPIVVMSAGAAVETIRRGEADIGFFAIDPARAGAGVDFSNPYLTIEGAYAVPVASPIQSMMEVDRVGVRLVVGQGSAYDLFLTREIKAASLVRAPTSQAVVPRLLGENLEVAANVRQQLEADMARAPGQLRLLPGAFMTIQQAMGVASGRDPRVAEALTHFVEEMKATGFVAEALRRHSVEGAMVAPAGRGG